MERSRYPVAPYLHPMAVSFARTLCSHYYREIENKNFMIRLLFARRLTSLAPSSASFSQFSLTRETQIAIRRSGIAVPTKAQEAVIPKLLEGKNVLFFAPTGEGKSQGYLIPLINKLIESDTEKLFPRPRRPRLVILVPTRELASQTLKCVRKFPIQSTGLSAGLSYAKESDALSLGADVVVGTPARFLLHHRKGNVTFQDVQSVVIDEADVLCDSLYESEMRDVLASLRILKTGNSSSTYANTLNHSRKQPASLQVVIVSATRTGSINQFVRDNLQSIAFDSVTAANTHTAPKSLEQVFVPVSGRPKEAILTEVLRERKEKTIVFTDKVKCAEWLSKTLADSGIAVSPFHSHLSAVNRQKSFKEFSHGRNNVLVATGIASRGLDIEGVGHIVLFDFPKTSADYLHKAGRTARAGGSGRVTALFNNRDSALVKKLQNLSVDNLAQIKAPKGSVIAKTLNLKRFEKALKALKNKRAVDTGAYQRLRKRCGLPKRDWLGGRESKLAMRAWHLRKKEKKEVKFLVKRGRLVFRKGASHRMPSLPDSVVERSDAQVVNVMVQGANGRLSIESKRRSLRKMAEEELQADRNNQLEFKVGRTLKGIRD